MKRNVFAQAAILALTLGSAAGAQSLTHPPLPPPSRELLAALSAVRSGPIDGLAAWADRAQPSDASGGALETIEIQIAALAPGDRDALVYWLGSHGRAALHAVGASDAQIGPPYFALDYAIVPGAWPADIAPLALPSPPPPAPAPQPKHHSSFLSSLASMIPGAQIPVASSSSSSSSTTSNADGSQTTTSQSSGTSVSVGVDSAALINSLIDASASHPASQGSAGTWRPLLFAAATLDADAGASQIAITHGFAASRFNGSEGLACLSFVNNAALTAVEVDVDFQMVDAYGFLRRVAPLRRFGSFATGQLIAGPSSVQDANASRPNCVVDGEGSLTDPTDPFAGAAAVLYAVRQVKYADGSTWLMPGANPWPATLKASSY